MKKLLLILLFLPMIGFGQGSNNDYSITTTLTSSAYFDIAYNNKLDYQYQIDNYTKCLRIDPDNAVAYNNRGIAHNALKNYKDALDDYSRTIRITPDYALVYYNRAETYSNIGNYKDAIDDYSRAIRINPEFASAYYNRGIARENTGLPYCSDYKRACDLGKEKCCEWYYKQCK